MALFTFTLPKLPILEGDLFIEDLPKDAFDYLSYWLKHYGIAFDYQYWSEPTFLNYDIIVILGN